VGRLEFGDVVDVLGEETESGGCVELVGDLAIAPE
jgi:hypothetical protein